MDKHNAEITFSTLNHLLREIPFFEAFTDDELDFFARNVSLRYFPDETVLFNEGDIGDYLFFVVEGKIEVCLQSTDSRPLIIAAFEQGSCIGEMSLVDDYPRSATIVVREPSELLILTKTRFETICRKNPQVGIKFLRGLAKNLSLRLRKTTGRFADLS